MRTSESTGEYDELKKGNISHLCQIFHYLKPYRLMLAAAALALIFTSFSMLAMGTALRYLVDAGIGEGNVELLNQGFTLMLGVILLLAVATYCRFYLVTMVGEKVVADIRRDVYKHLISMDIGFFEVTRTGELLSRITTDTTLLQSVIGSSVSVALRNSILITGGIGLLLYTSPKLTQYVLLILPLVVAPIIILGKKVRALSRESQNKVADISAHAEETLYSIRTIQSLSLEQQQADRFGDKVHETLQIAMQRISKRALLTAIVIALVFGAIVGVLWMGGRDVIAGNITAGDLSAFIFYAVVVAGAVGALSDVIGDLQRAGGATERLMELMEQDSWLKAPEHPAQLPESIKGNIRFNNVAFHYPARQDKAALQDVHVAMKPGERVALVGPSGAGKTTIFRLLLRFYDPKEGAITIDDVDIKNLVPSELRGHIGFVPQDPTIFSANAWDNIRCGKLDASNEEIIEAARAASAVEFIEKLPEGFDTFLGEKGVRLSGGQRQRIAIARAMIRNPQILLLDEATSALDSENEKLVQQAIEAMMEGRTTLVIAHRLSTVKQADRILVMDEGKIMAEGTHDELLQSSELYHRLASLQFNTD